MNNLYILTEERPKNHIVQQIIELFGQKYSRDVEIINLRILPEIINGKHDFNYEITGVNISNIDKIRLKVVSGDSSFVDYLIYESHEFPNENQKEGLKLIIEETKTGDDESRNTGVYQRISKFIYSDYLLDEVPKIMIYNDSNYDPKKTPSDTSIFGTNMLLTQNVEIIGKNMEYFKKFDSIDEMIDFKDAMGSPPQNNVPIKIKKFPNKITVSGRLSKPKDKGNIAHDPNIGALTSIAYTLRLLGWDKDIIIEKHGVNQEYLHNRRRSNKFLTLATFLDVKLEGVDFDVSNYLPTRYWHYEMRSEKITTIFLHVLSINKNSDIKSIYDNHAGGERGYFTLKDESEETINKRNRQGNVIAIPDLVLINKKTKEMLVIEGKQSSRLQNGLIEIESYDLIEQEYLRREYPEYKISRWVTTFGENIYSNGLDDEVLIHINLDGEILINQNAPKWIEELVF
ncbi:MAG: hypothetical protein LBM96_02715 [Methanobrevibacter sp.]|jgi:hypothetical protein|nr:hypothetical protein [Candidatus Methanoflexus mossambicus]